MIHLPYMYRHCNKYRFVCRFHVHDSTCTCIVSDIFQVHVIGCMSIIDNHYAATHGTGVKFGNLATLVTKLRFISGSGEVSTIMFHLSLFVQCFSHFMHTCTLYVQTCLNMCTCTIWCYLCMYA